MRSKLILFLPTFLLLIGGALLFNTLNEDFSLVPSLFKGRFRPFEVVSRALHEEDLDIAIKRMFLEKEKGILVFPSKNRREWLPLTLLDSHSTSHNPTAFEDAIFQESKERLPSFLASFGKEHYSLEKKKLSDLILQGYLIFKEKSLGNFPSLFQLKAELFYSKVDIIFFVTLLYVLAVLFYLKKFSVMGDSCFFAGFSLLTALLMLRIIILERPPVSNMQETLFFVPWVSACLGLLLKKTLKTVEPLLGVSLLSLVLLFFARYAFKGDGLEVNPAVLNSRFWLMIHVLMVVSSYAFFLVAGILAHIHLLGKQENNALFRVILTTLYAGTFFLISGTILGGVWAQESWGRFWDWDPKESWAFISSSFYLILIHLYHFGYIYQRGLSSGAILGLLSIGFTWYGVNYLLGTGLHSYGFGSGGVPWFLLFCLLEIAFLFFVFIPYLKKIPKKDRL